MFLEPTVQAAFVVILAWLIKLAANAVGIELDEVTVNSIAAAIVIYILSKIAPPVVQAVRVRNSK
jgi:putative Mn2+ efflux pump MntP